MMHLLNIKYVFSIDQYIHATILPIEVNPIVLLCYVRLENQTRIASSSLFLSLRADQCVSRRLGPLPKGEKTSNVAQANTAPFTSSISQRNPHHFRWYCFPGFHLNHLCPPSVPEFPKAFCQARPSQCCHHCDTTRAKVSNLFDSRGCDILRNSLSMYFRLPELGTGWRGAVLENEGGLLPRRECKCMVSSERHPKLY